MAHITKEGSRWLVSGSMNIQQVELMLAEKAIFKAADEVEIDLSGISDVETATISLLFEWLRQARNSKCNLTYTSLPQKLVDLATLYGVLELIPLVPGPK